MTKKEFGVDDTETIIFLLKREMEQRNFLEAEIAAIRRSLNLNEVSGAVTRIRNIEKRFLL